VQLNLRFNLSQVSLAAGEKVIDDMDFTIAPREQASNKRRSDESCSSGYDIFFQGVHS